MTAPPSDRVGDLLIAAKVLTAEDIAAGLAHARAHGLLLGKALIDLGMVDAKLLRAVLDAQLVTKAPTTADRLRASVRMFRAARETVQDIHAALDRLERATSKG